MSPIRTAFLLLLLASHAALAEDAPALLITTEPLPYNIAGTILGRRVATRDGQDFGMLVDVLVDLDGQPRAGVIDVGGFMGVGMKRIAIAWALLHFSRANDEVRIVEDLTTDEAAAAPEFPGQEGAAIVTGRAPSPP